MSRTDPRPHSLRHLTSPIGRIELLGDGTAVTSLAIERDGALPHDVCCEILLLGFAGQCRPERLGCGSPQ